MKLWRVRVWALGLVLVTLTACGAPASLVLTPTPAPPPVTPQLIHVACSESLEPACMALASVYQRSFTATQIVTLVRVDDLAYTQLVQGDVDLAMLAWLPEQLPDGTWLAPFAQDGLAIVVNPQNGLPGLSLEQLRKLFQGQVESWEPWGGLPGSPQLVSREDASGDTRYFQSWVMRDARIALTALLAPSSEAVLQFVVDDAWSVGYLSTSRLNDTVRAIPIDGVPPAPEAIESGLYPLTRVLFLLSIGDPSGPAREFAQWVLSPSGRELLITQGLRPLSE